MAAQSATARYVPVGVNHGNQYYCEAIAPGALVQNDNFTITTPDGVDGDLIPIVAVVYEAGTLRAAAIVSYTTKTVVVKVTDAAGAAAGSRAVVEFIGG